MAAPPRATPSSAQDGRTAAFPNGDPVVYSYTKEALVASDLSTGAPRWTAEGAGTYPFVTLSPDGDQVFTPYWSATGEAASLGAFDAATGARQWVQPITLCFAGSTVDAGYANEQTVLLDATTGEQLAYDPAGEQWCPDGHDDVMVWWGQHVNEGSSDLPRSVSFAPIDFWDAQVSAARSSVDTK